MHIVVTGAAGFIGSHTCEALIARGHRVTGIDAYDGTLYAPEIKRRNARELARLPADRFTLHEGDITNPAAIETAIGRDTDVVCHLAALAGVRPSLLQPTRYFRTNVEGTALVLERMRELGLRRLVFASSSSVYGVKPTSGTAFDESDLCLAPASPYAASKRMAELLLSTYRDLYGIGSFALRFFTVYGPRQRPDMAIPKFVSAIAANKPITLFGDGSSRRDYTFIDDIVAGTVAAIERVTPEHATAINLGGAHTTSLAELVSLIERVSGRSAVILREPDQPGDVPLTSANVERARSLLGYAPTVDLEAGITRYWRWVQALA